ncbi:MAG: hypothetical protein ACLQVI_37305 [Polyangiaceae bacterium]
MTTRPGLVKGRRPPFVDVSRAPRARTTDALWRNAFDLADAVSEGAARLEARGNVWYGSTSLILKIEARTDEERAFLVAIAERDLHVRTRALRVAVREAAVRAGARLGRSQCEVRFAVDPGGVRIDVDVQAPFIEKSGAASRRTR